MISPELQKILSKDGFMVALASIQEHWFAGLIGTLATMFFFLFVKYAGLRYRMNHTTFKGIRGSLGGSAIKYGMVATLMMVGLFMASGLIVIALSFVATFLFLGAGGVFLIPVVAGLVGGLLGFIDFWKVKYIVSNMSFGGEAFQFKGTKGSLVKAGALHLVGIALGMALLTFLFAGSFDVNNGNAVATGFAGFFLPVMFVILFIAARAWYRAKFLQAFIGGVEGDTIRLNATHTFAGILWVRLGNILLLLLSFGITMGILGILDVVGVNFEFAYAEFVTTLIIIVGTASVMPIVYHRMMKYFINNIVVFGNPLSEEFLQESQKSGAYGDAADEFFDDAGLDIDMGLI